MVIYLKLKGICYKIYEKDIYKSITIKINYKNKNKHLSFGVTMNKSKVSLAILMASVISPAVLATNGMNMEGFGPVSTAMGGTAVAYDNGLAGLMTNPATVGMNIEEGSIFQFAIGNLRPDVSATDSNGNTSKSGGTSYVMPGFGLATKSNGFTYGIGVMAQGGMGTEFSANSVVALGSGDSVRSEVGIGRVVIPLNYEVTDKLTLGMSLDWVWAGMDIKMAVPGAAFLSDASGGLVDMPGTNGDFAQFVGGAEFGLMPGNGGSVNPNTGALTMPNGMGGAGPTISTGRFDFSNDSDYTGEAKGSGFGYKLGAIYKLSDSVTFGLSYASKTNLNDFTTNNAQMSMQVEGMGSVPLTGEVEIKDFQWPDVLTAGIAYQPSDKWLFTADVERMGWAESMKSLKMTFTANDSASNVVPGFGDFKGDSISVELPQNWEDQTIIMIGTQYSVTKQLDLRVGMNISDNPVPNETLHSLFPAIIEKHYTTGFGYQVTEASALDFSLTYAPEVKATNAFGITSAHSQTTWQAMYTYNF